MRRLLLVTCIITALASGSCKKVVENQAKKAILSAMTNGRWYVELYTATGTDISGQFTGYEFQFYEDNKVDALYGGVTKSTGGWTPDISNYTITAAFPPAAGDTLVKLNYTWKLTDSYEDYVEAKTTTSAGDNILHLRKK